MLIFVYVVDGKHREIVAPTKEKARMLVGDNVELHLDVYYATALFNRQKEQLSPLIKAGLLPTHTLEFLKNSILCACCTGEEYLQLSLL